MKKTLVIALGGNALLQRGEVLSAQNQYKNIEQVASVVAALAPKYRIVIVHGNGPQVGLLALQNQACDLAPPYPLDILVAETQGMLGYMITQTLGQMSNMPTISSLLTRIEVDPADIAFNDPSKFIGPVYPPSQEQALVANYGYKMKRDGEYLRRVVASPRPLRVLEIDAIRHLLSQGNLVICGGGGGVPVAHGERGFVGVEAVIDKDLAASLLAKELKAEYLMILTDADAVYQDWGTPQARALRNVTVETLRPFAAPDGSMGPKAQAVIEFVEQTGKTAFIGALKDAADILKGNKGTKVVSTQEAIVN
ncbi:carbamate kinase [Budviciaceae bacterium BWR-B9]|uniref:Carbamate kinase n=1 Tax=Limnobaculum allomyrinae TaxID=2791986 RepID=A0ABS1ILU7_9GAMM|nr:MULTISPECIES: carbamate kinase [Limnobaculum]MBK5142682.1 carbamate kinase [Limnobaculum allomyrinae]MBV7690432.1 carbamate kinase [Limnobaculum sp. M2-1]